MRTHSRRLTRFPTMLGRLLVVGLFVACAAGRVAAQSGGSASGGPGRQDCQAARDGSRLTTTVTFPDGYSAQARWTVLGYGTLSAKPEVPANVELEIDAVVEGSAAAGWREHSRFAPPFRMKLVRTTLDEITRDASVSWCNIVGTLRTTSPAAPLAALARIT